MMMMRARRRWCAPPPRCPAQAVAPLIPSPFPTESAQLPPKQPDAASDGSGFGVGVLTGVPRSLSPLRRLCCNVVPLPPLVASRGTAAGGSALPSTHIASTILRCAQAPVKAKAKAAAPAKGKAAPAKKKEESSGEHVWHDRKRALKRLAYLPVLLALDPLSCGARGSPASFARL